MKKIITTIILIFTVIHSGYGQGNTSEIYTYYYEMMVMYKHQQSDKEIKITARTFPYIYGEGNNTHNIQQTLGTFAINAIAKQGPIEMQIVKTISEILPSQRYNWETLWIDTIIMHKVEIKDVPDLNDINQFDNIDKTTKEKNEKINRDYIDVNPQYKNEIDTSQKNKNKYEQI